MALYDDYMRRMGGALSSVSSPEVVHGQGAIQQQGPARQQPALANLMPSDAMSVGALQQPGTPPPVQPQDILVRPPPQPKENLPQISFEDLAENMPEREKTAAVNQLEEQVGDIDEAYEALIKQMGERPDEKLTREEKGMLIMEFGLHLMANSSASRHGEDFAGAAGDAGLSALQSFKQIKSRKRAEGEAYDRTMAAIVGERAEAERLGRQEARETALTEAQIGEIKANTARINRQATEQNLPTPNWITYKDSETGYEYAVDTANPEESRVRLGKMAPGDQAGERPFEFQVKFDYYMNTYGRDADGNELPPEQRNAVAKQALDFANRTDSMSRGDAYVKARELADAASEQGLLRDPEGEKTRQQLYDDEVEKIMTMFGYGQQEQPTQSNAGGGPRGGNIPREQDVTDQIPDDVLRSMPEGVRQRNPQTGQTFIRRGNRVFLIPEFVPR